MVCSPLGPASDGHNFLITDNYPPFTLQETDEDTIQLVAEYPSGSRAGVPSSPG